MSTVLAASIWHCLYGMVMAGWMDCGEQPGAGDTIGFEDNKLIKEVFIAFKLNCISE